MVAKKDIYGMSFDSEEYSEDFVQSGNLPLVQALNPKDRSEEAIEAVKGYGLFIETPRAEAAGFTPDGKRWIPWEHRFGVSGGGEKKPGFLCRNPRMFVLAQSQIEVYEKYMVNDRMYTRYAGLAYINGQPTDFNEMATLGAKIDTPAGERPQFSRMSRYLLMFVGEDNKFLHEIPFVLKAAGGWAASLGAEFQAHSKAVSDRYREYRAAQGKKSLSGYLSPDVIAKTIFDIEIGWYMGAQGSAFIVPKSRLHPVANIDNLGKEKKVKDKSGTRDIVLKGVRLGDLMFGKQSNEAIAIDEILNLYPDFAKPPSPTEEENIPEEQPTPPPVAAQHQPQVDDDWGWDGENFDEPAPPITDDL